MGVAPKRFRLDSLRPWDVRLALVGVDGYRIG
jgi:hypothetical protein